MALLEDRFKAMVRVKVVQDSRKMAMVSPPKVVGGYPIPLMTTADGARVTMRSSKSPKSV